MSRTEGRSLTEGEEAALDVVALLDAFANAITAGASSIYNRSVADILADLDEAADRLPDHLRDQLRADLRIFDPEVSE